MVQDTQIKATIHKNLELRLMFGKNYKYIIIHNTPVLKHIVKSWLYSKEGQGTLNQKSEVCYLIKISLNNFFLSGLALNTIP